MRIDSLMVIRGDGASAAETDLVLLVVFVPDTLLSEMLQHAITAQQLHGRITVKLYSSARQEATRSTLKSIASAWYFNRSTEART